MRHNEFIAHLVLLGYTPASGDESTYEKNRILIHIYYNSATVDDTRKHVFEEYNIEANTFEDVLDEIVHTEEKSNDSARIQSTSNPIRICSQ